MNQPNLAEQADRQASAQPNDAGRAPLHPRHNGAGSGLRTRLAWLLCLFALTAIAGIWFGVHLEREAAIDSERTALRSLVRELANHQDGLLGDTSAFLDKLANDGDPVWRTDPVACGRALGLSLHGDSHALGNLLILRANGQLWCAAKSAPKTERFANNPAFLRAMHSNRVEVGAMDYPAHEPHAHLPLFRALPPTAGGEQLVLMAELELTWLNRTRDRLAHLPDTRVVLLDPQAKIVYAAPETAGLAGTDAAKTEAWQKVHKMGREGAFEALGLDGKTRSYALAPFGSRGTQDHTISVTVPVASIEAASPRVVVRVGAVAVLLLAMLVVALWLATDRLVLAPVGALSAAFERLAAGDLETQLHLRTNVRELNQLAAAFSAAVAGLRERAERQRAMETLQASESILAQAEAVGDAFSWRVDLETGRLQASKRLEELSGLSREVLGVDSQALLQFVHPDDRAYVTERFQAALAANTDPAPEFLYRMVWPDGSVRLMRGRTALEQAPDGTPISLLGVAHDVTDVTRLQSALRERIKELRCLYDVFRLTEDEDQPDEALMSAVARALPPGFQFDDAEAEIRCTERSFATAQFGNVTSRLTVEFRAGDNQGAVTVGYLGAHPESDEGPFLREERQLLQAIASRLTDVLRNRSEHRRQRDEAAVYQAYFEQSRDAFVTVDPATLRFASFNAVAHESLGYTREQFAAMHIPELDAALEPQEMAQKLGAMLTPDGAVAETSLRCADGSTREVRVSGRLIQVGARPILACTWTDYTDIKKAQSDLQRMTADERMMASVTQAVLFSTDPNALMSAVTDILVMERGYGLAWFARAVADEDKSVAVDAYTGAEEHLFGMSLSWQEGTRGMTPVGKSLRLGEVHDVPDIASAPECSAWRASALRHNLLSCVAVPLGDSGCNSARALSVFSRRKSAFAGPEIAILRDVANRVAYGLRSMADRATRAQAEAESRKLLALVEQSSSSVLITGLDARIEYANDAACLHSGYGKSELLGQNPRMLSSGLNPPATYSGLWQALSEGRQWSGEFVNRRKDGSLFTERAVVMPLRDAAGTIQHYAAVKEDITALKVVEERVRKLSRAVEQSPASVVVTDLDARIEYVNPAFLRQTGYELQELVGQNPRVLQSGRTPPETYQAMWSALQQGQTWQGELVNRRKDGSEYFELATLAPVRDESGIISHYVAIKEDITDRKEMVAELERHRSQLEQMVAERTVQLNDALVRAEAASHAKSAFLANTSHEIRTPLNAIIGLTHILIERSRDAEEQVRLRKIEGAAKHLLSIINDILDLSKVEAGKLRVEQTAFLVQDVVATVQDAIAVRAADSGLSLVVDLDPDVPALVGDPVRITQVLMNLAANAVKFTPKGSVQIRVQLEGPETARQLRCEVEDTGIGMTPEQQSRAFLPFEQADVSTTRRFGGTGLGLSVSRRLVELMGGQMGCTSAAGVGSTFWFTLPVALAPAGHLHPASIHQQEGRGSELPERAPDQLKVLLVEDDVTNQEVAVELLALRGIHTDVAANGQIAVEMATAKEYDLVLMDLQMPVMDGLAATRALRAMPTYQRTPILAMTASAYAEDRNACLAAGMNDFVAKPVQPKGLYATIRQYTGVVLPESTSAPVPDGPGAIEALAPIRGLVPADGLRVTDGNQASYLRLLRRFATERRGDVAQLRDLVDSNQWTEAHRLVHTLKGSAATIGGRDVRHAAQQVEELLRKAHVPSETLAEAINQLEAASTALFAELDAHLPSESAQVASQTVDWARLADAVPALLALLRHDDVQALHDFRLLAEPLRAAAGGAFAAIEQAVEGFEFETAAAKLEEWQASVSAQLDAATAARS